MECNPDFRLEPEVLKLKVLVLGDSGAGKTAVVRRIIKDAFTESYSATVGVDFSVKVINIGQDFEIRLQLWDLAGQDRFNHLSRLYYREASGGMLVCDESRPNSLTSVHRWKGELDARLQYQVPAALLVNKADLVEFEDEGIADKLIEETCDRLKIGSWSRTSAKDGYGVDDCVKALLWDIMASQERRNSQASEMVKPGDEEVIRLQKQTLTNTAGKNKPGCCV